MTKFNAFSLMLGLAIAGPALASGVFFSEYIEGSSNNKAIEIYNMSGVTLDLSTVQVKVASNGSPTYNTTIQPVGMLGHGCNYVIAHTLSNATILAAADLTNSNLNFNGDDHVALFINAVAVDGFGTLGFDPGASWPVPGGTTVNQTLRRNIAVVDGSMIWTGVVDQQWDVYPQDNSADLGMHGSIPCGGNINPTVANVLLNPAAPTEDDPVNVSADLTDADGTVLMADLKWGLASNALTNTIAMQLVAGDTWSTMVPIPDMNGCTTVFYQVVATDNAMGVAQSPVASYTVECNLTITQIQGAGANSPYDGASVCTQGTVQRVVADRFFIQDGTGPRQGITVFTGSALTVAVGDLVEVCGIVDEFFNLTEFTGNPAVSVISAGNPTYAPVVLDAATAATEDYESMLLTVGPMNVTSVQNGFGEFLLADMSGTIQADVDYFVIDPAPELDDCYTLTGIQFYSFGDYTLFPTEAGDVVSCNPADTDGLAASFSLSANYPNPFNPTTTIDFTLGVTGETSLVVFDLAGREVARLAGGVMSAGAHSVVFDASELASGVYFYTLNAEGFSTSRKMVLVK